MHLYLCHACANGMHSSCDGVRPAPPGVFGGSMCSCNCQQQPMEHELEKAKSLLDMMKPRHVKVVKKCQWQPLGGSDFLHIAACTEEKALRWGGYKFCPYCGDEIESI